jgi:hypothetical protein
MKVLSIGGEVDSARKLTRKGELAERSCLKELF